MGAYPFLRDYLEATFNRQLVYAGRAASASPATGSARTHADEQERLVRQAVSG
jgi:2-oxoglutarate dehydrogenase complex dehydrogenase (E1) component-like enzyme